MFRYCKDIKTLDDLKHWDIGGVSTMKYMFCYCTCLESTDGLLLWNVRNDVVITGMFVKCCNADYDYILRYWKLPSTNN